MDFVVNAVNKKYTALHKKQTARMPAALTELEMIHYLKQ